MPPEREAAIVEAPVPVAASVDNLEGVLKEILQGATASGVPLGINVESVSIFKEEIDASFELLRRCQALLTQ